MQDGRERLATTRCQDHVLAQKTTSLPLQENVSVCARKANVLSSFILLRPHCLGLFFHTTSPGFSFQGWVAVQGTKRYSFPPLSITPEPLQQTGLPSTRLTADGEKECFRRLLQDVCHIRGSGDWIHDVAGPSQAWSFVASENLSQLCLGRFAGAQDFQGLA